MAKSLYGLIGKSLVHSFSKDYFTNKFVQRNINAEYLNFELQSIEEFTEIVQKSINLKGLNVTIPYKETIIKYLDEISAEATEIGAVNCIKIDKQNNKIIGYNTDAFGFAQSIKPFLESGHTKALILGNGGASKAVKYVLKNLGIDCFFAVREKKHEHGKLFLYEELTIEMIHQIPLIVNTTSLGTFPAINEIPPIPASSIGSKHFVVDLIYNPLETELLKISKKQGALTLNGLSMLKIQAEKSWEIWNS
jgi:shikimate dehydrogenase